MNKIEILTIIMMVVCCINIGIIGFNHNEYNSKFAEIQSIVGWGCCLLVALTLHNNS